MASLNKFIGIGNLTKDVEVKFMTNGDAVANFSIACNETWKDKTGAKQEKVEYINIVIYRKLAEIADEYLKKGSQVYIEGKLQTRKWQTKEGQDRYTTEIIANSMQMLGSKTQNNNQGNTDYQPAENNAPQSVKTGVDAMLDMEEDVPF